MAATASATAVGLVPNQALVIARAAAAACPSKAGAIVEAICRVLPAEYEAIASAVAEVVPGAGREILAGISTAVPQLKSTIDQTLVSYQGSIPSVNTVLSQVVQAQSAVALATMVAATPGAAHSGLGTARVMPQGVASGPPLVPFTGTPAVYNGYNPGTIGLSPTAANSQPPP